MDEDPDKIEDHIRSTRRELGSNLRELENRVKDATDWRVQFERHPWMFLGAAFAGGLLLSASLGGRRRPAYEGERRGTTYTATRTGASSEHSTTREVWDKIKGGLVAAAGSQINNLLAEFLPGFREHSQYVGSARATERAQPSKPGANGGGGQDTAAAGTAAGTV